MGRDGGRESYRADRHVWSNGLRHTWLLPAGGRTVQTWGLLPDVPVGFRVDRATGVGELGQGRSQ
ncbi:hypothetical protein GCM10009764_38880 [Nocardia ninae]|uniref:Uncharacterized protein n=1 Tax=Nocardia ninae NBRC 108245 TaxID=1210091 RepID=A0A511MP76_9NOCA|nr:hypothetical protein NN4_69310 [Nocardia ninae NBRC 108245]